MNGLFNNDKSASLNSLWVVKPGAAGAVNLLATGSYMIYAVGDDASHTCPSCTQVVAGGYFDHTQGDGASFTNSVPLTSPRFIDNGDGTLADTVTGLTWLKKADCINMSWAASVTAINNLASGQCGLTDGSTAGQWRMPNRQEMRSIADHAATFPIANYYNGITGADGITVIIPVIFNSFMVSQYYWTSTTDAADISQAWTVYSCDFGVYNTSKTDVGYSLAVR